MWLDSGLTIERQCPVAETGAKGFRTEHIPIPELGWVGLVEGRSGISCKTPKTRASKKKCSSVDKFFPSQIHTELLCRRALQYSYSYWYWYVHGSSFASMPYLNPSLSCTGSGSHNGLPLNGSFNRDEVLQGSVPCSPNPVPLPTSSAKRYCLRQPWSPAFLSGYAGLTVPLLRKISAIILSSGIRGLRVLLYCRPPLLIITDNGFVWVGKLYL